MAKSNRWDYWEQDSDNRDLVSMNHPIHLILTVDLTGQYRGICFGYEIIGSKSYPM